MTNLLLILYFLSPFILAFVLFACYFEETKRDSTPSIQEALWPYFVCLGGLIILTIVLFPFLTGAGHSHGSGGSSILDLPFYLLFLVPAYCIYKLYSVWLKLSSSRKITNRRKAQNTHKRAQRKW